MVANKVLTLYTLRFCEKSLSRKNVTTGAFALDESEILDVLQFLI